MSEFPFATFRKTAKDVFKEKLVNPSPPDERPGLQDFIDSLTDEQAEKLIKLNGFTAEYDIPIWNDKIGSPAHDPNKERATPPDSYLKGKTTPRNIADDLYILLLGTHSQEEIIARIDAFKKLDERYSQYWQSIGDILYKGKQKRPRHDKSLDFLSTSNGRQLSITHEKYQYALSLHKNKTAYIRKLDGGIFDNLRFNQQGQLEVSPDIEQSINTALKKTQDAQGFDPTILQQIFTAVYKAQVGLTPYTITIHIPTFCREMGIDIHSSKANDIFSKLKVFENCLGVLGGNKYYAVLVIIGIDTEANTMTFAAPYMNQLLLEIANNPAKKVETKAYKYEIPGYSWLIHSSIVSERNEPAKQLVNLIIAALLQRGGTPDNQLKQNKGREGVSEKVNYDISCKTLVNNTPILRQRIAQGTTADKNKTLKRAFTGAYNLLKTRTDAYKYFVSLNVSEVVPTMTTLNAELHITHSGINPEYKEKSPEKVYGELP